LVMPPELRQSAQYCLDQALLLSDPGQERSPSQTPTPTSYARGCQSVSQHTVADEYGEDQSTILLQDDTDQATGLLQHSEDQPTVLLEDWQTFNGHWRYHSLGVDSIDPEEIRRHTRSGGPPPESQLSGDFDEWLRDPLHSIGGGSVLATLEEGITDQSSSAAELGEAADSLGIPDSEEFGPPSSKLRKRSTRPSKSSSSSSGRHTKRRENRHSSHQYNKEPEHSNQGCEAALLEEPACAEGILGAGETYDYGRGWGEEGRVVDPWTESV